eukprot:COSAG02_NODE_10205_length_1995_cov_52.975645_2_plen_152_part_00
MPVSVADVCRQIPGLSLNVRLFQTTELSAAAVRCAQVLLGSAEYADEFRENRSAGFGLNVYLFRNTKFQYSSRILLPTCTPGVWISRWRIARGLPAGIQGSSGTYLVPNHCNSITFPVLITNTAFKAGRAAPSTVGSARPAVAEAIRCQMA